LHQLLDTSASNGGSLRLRAGLLAPTPNPVAIRERQAVLRELGPLSGFRSRLALQSALVESRPGERWDGDVLLAWLEHTASIL
jgi:hypothetical protein